MNLKMSSKKKSKDSNNHNIEIEKSKIKKNNRLSILNKTFIGKKISQAELKGKQVTINR